LNCAVRRVLRWLTAAAPVVVVLGLAEVHARWIGHYRLVGSSRLGWTVLYIVFLEMAAYVMGLPGTPRSAMGAIGSAIGAVALGAGVVSLAQLLVGAPLLPRFVVLASSGVLAVAWSALAIVDQRAAPSGGDRVLAVLDPDEAVTLHDDLTMAPERTARLVDVVDQDEATAAGPRSPLLEAVAQSGATVLVLGRGAQGSEAVVAQAAELHGRGIRVRTLTLFYDEWLGKLPVSDLERLSLMFDIQELHVPRYARLKRVVDLVAALVGLVLLVPAVVLVLVLDLAGNRGPLFFRQVRVGKGGHPFTIVKFRTMAPGSGEGTWTADADPRLAPVGRWMRRVHLDELPQALNVLRGELSLVGPRPEQPRYVAELTEKIPFYEIRHLVKPGVTGWAQVKFPYGASVEDALEKLQYEFYYLRHQGPLLDTRIVARTLRAVLFHHGR